MCVCVCVCIDAHGAMVIVVGNGFDDPTLNPGRGCLHYT